MAHLCNNSCLIGSGCIISNETIQNGRIKHTIQVAIITILSRVQKEKPYS